MMMGEGFRSAFGKSPRFELSVPARICVFGDHSDYVPYLGTNIVTFASAEQRMFAHISPRTDSIVKVLSSLEGCDPIVFSIHDVGIQGPWLETLDSLGAPDTHWSNYVKGAVAYLGNKRRIEYGFEMFVQSTIPAASGASSSSALTICALAAAHIANNISWTPRSLSEMGGEAEWYVGTRGGMMDHATMMYAEKGKMIKLGFRPFDAKLVEDSLGCKWHSVYTHPAEKGGAARDSFNELAIVQREIIPEYLTGIEFDLEGDLELVVNQLPKTVEHAGLGAINIRDRFRFVLNEFSRVQSFISMLEEPNDEEIVRLFESSWNDTRDLLMTHTPEMEIIASQLREREGVLGVKVLGAGFGGNLLVCAKSWAELGPDAVEHTPGAGLVLVELN